MPVTEVEHGEPGDSRYGHLPLLARIWQLRHNMWPYDAAYVALAEALGVELVTLDGKMEKAPGLTCPIRNLRRITREG